MGILTNALAQTVERENPDFLFVIGDREGIAALVALHGCVGGSSWRGGHSFWKCRRSDSLCVSKLSHIHFALSRQYADNIAKVGEEDFHLLDRKPRPEQHQEHNTFPWRRSVGILVSKSRMGSSWCSSSTRFPRSRRTRRFRSTKACGPWNNFVGRLSVIGSYPNTDPGAYDILNASRPIGSIPAFIFSKRCRAKYLST